MVEFLTFSVPPESRDEWLRVEEHHWTRFLERQPGFVRKEVWCCLDDVHRVQAVIWWESMEAWKSIPQHELDEVARAMGPFERIASCTAFERVRITEHDRSD